MARLACVTGAAVVPVFALWSESERRYVVRFQERMAMSGQHPDAPAALSMQPLTGRGACPGATVSGQRFRKPRARSAEDTRQMYAMLEQVVREHPDQYFWIFNPAGANAK
jgi:lauroyl/myristoyl acyltransferase